MTLILAVVGYEKGFGFVEIKPVIEARKQQSIDYVYTNILN